MDSGRPLPGHQQEPHRRSDRDPLASRAPSKRRSPSSKNTPFTEPTSALCAAKKRWNLPQVAVRETIINAVAHTDYAQRGAPLRISIFDDRLEVENPGLLPFGLGIDDLPRGVSKLRNRVIGRVFHALGLVEQWGSGIQRMSAACREAGLAPPPFEELATRFRVTIATARVVGASVLDDTDQAILASLADGDGYATSEIAAVIGLTPRATRTRLARLVGNGHVSEIGTGPQDPRRRYYLAERAPA